MRNKIIRTGLPIRPEVYSNASGYGIRLDALDNEKQSILDYFSSKGEYSDKYEWFKTNYINQPMKSRKCLCTHPSCFSYRNKCQRLLQIDKEKDEVIEEMKKEEQALKDQEILKQKALADEAKVEVEKALEELEKAKNKTAQEQAKAQKELAIAQAAQQLAESGRTDDAARLLGQKVKSYKGLVVGGIILGALGVGFIVYKMLVKKKVV